MYYLDSGLQKHNRFRNALLLALAVHAAIVFSVSFSMGQAAPRPTQIEVTLATQLSDKAPEDAQRLAQTNQEGSGNEADINDITTSTPMAVGELSTETVAAKEQEVQIAEQDVVATTEASTQQAQRDPQERQRAEANIEGITPEIAHLSRELASLQAELDEQTRALNEAPRVRRLNAASARQSADAAYLLDWRQRLEAVGNLYYPEASVRYGIFGAVRLLVVIRSDGSLENIEVLSSSGYAVLDESAIKVVRMAAPFSPFPDALRATTDKLEIVRTWHYEENRLSSH